jgi:CRISPR-associated protein Cas1
VISCGHTHLPEGLFLPLSGNSVQSQMFQNQISAKNALKKQLWKQTVTAKIINQYKVLEKCSRQADTLKRLSRKVTSGDKENLEAQAAAYYWKQLFPEEIEFERDRDGAPPNNLLNYGYAILRGIVARSLVSSGLLPTLGIHHHNKYNAYCLADDIMEPYRPFVDDVVIKLFLNLSDCSVLDTAIKKELLSISTLAVTIDGETGPLLVMMHRTTASLAKCFSGLTRKLAYPVFEST